MVSRPPHSTNMCSSQMATLLIVWAKDVWKDRGDGSWSSSSTIDSDYDLFYRLIDPSDLSFLTEEVRLTDTTVHEYITNVRQAEVWEVGETTSDYFIFYQDPSGEKFHKVDDLTAVSPENTAPTQLGGIHRFEATFTNGETRELSVSDFLNGSDSETPNDQLGIAIKGPVTNSSFEVSLDGNPWSAVVLADQEILHLDRT